MKAFLGLGSNLLNRLENLKTAISYINKLENTKVLKVSKIYETEPFDVLDQQNKYLNCCVLVETDFTPEVFLGCLLGIEVAMGRTRPFFHASRIIDIDLLIFENLKLNAKNLVLPHPGILKRAFVLVPLSDIYNEEYYFKFLNVFDKIDKSGVKLFLEGINFE